MSSIYPAYSFAPDYRTLDAFKEQIFGSCTQENFAVYQSMLGGWFAPACNYEVSPWPWQWSGETTIQKVCLE
jgi:hypothetical protein